MSGALHLAVRNAVALTTALARARGHELVTRPGFAAVEGPGLLRVLVRRPDPAADDLAELRLLVGRAGARVVVEDSFGTVDGAALGLASRHMPVMIREAGPLAPPAEGRPGLAGGSSALVGGSSALVGGSSALVGGPSALARGPSGPAGGPSALVEVSPVRTAAHLAVAERVVVEGFPMSGFPPGEALPAGLLDTDGCHLHLARFAGEPAGACLTVVAEGVGGVYWVTTLPAHRSRGVGRALMRAVLGEFPVPMTLTATAAGRPLYDSLGFSVVTRATWWSNDRPA